LYNQKYQKILADILLLTSSPIIQFFYTVWIWPIYPKNFPSAVFLSRILFKLFYNSIGCTNIKSAIRDFISRYFSRTI